VKNICSILALLFLFCGIGHAHQSDCSTSEVIFASCEKIYVEAAQVAITSGGIYFQHGDSWMITDAIHCDSAGLFVSSISNSDNEWSFTWECPKCHYVNGPLARECGNCGYRG